MLSIINRGAAMQIPLFCPSDICAKVDKQYFRRAVGNLVQNATRYCSHAIEVSVELEKKKGLILIHVDDDGPGIPEAERVRIFEPFARLDQSRTRDSGGYGLGLAIVRQIAMLQGGDVVVSESSLGGSRFTLSIPDCGREPQFS